MTTQVNTSSTRRSEPLLTERQAARHLGLTQRALQAWRYQGIGPSHIRISRRCIRYRPSDLDAWIASRVRRSTSDDGSQL